MNMDIDSNKNPKEQTALTKETWRKRNKNISQGVRQNEGGKDTEKEAEAAQEIESQDWYRWPRENMLKKTEYTGNTRKGKALSRY